jgi:hypothetical protein
LKAYYQDRQKQGYTKPIFLIGVRRAREYKVDYACRASGTFKKYQNWGLPTAKFSIPAVIDSESSFLVFKIQIIPRKFEKIKNTYRYI